MIRLAILMLVPLGAPPPKNHWAYQAPVRAGVPSVRDEHWPRNPIDRFVLARLEKERLAPSPEADRATLLRRLCLDLTGLPPTPRQVDDFLSDPSPDAYEKQVDQLLASPHYGERWGRHWLDAARYADSDGYEKDTGRPNAWRWRDWVIGALNRDMPFNQFTVEQLAGDLLPNATVDQKTATGFHRNTLTNTEGGVDREQFRVEATVDRTNTTMAVWMGLTFGCAQCHNHKYDPFTQKDYYQVFAFFNNADEFNLPLGPPPVAKAGEKKSPPADFIPIMQESRGRKTHVLTRGDFLRPAEPVSPGFPEAFATGSPKNRLDFARWLMTPPNPLTARVHVNWTWQKHFGRGLVATPEDFGVQGQRPSHPELLDWLATEFARLNWSRKALHRLVVCSATYRQSSNHRPELKERDPLNVLLARQSRLRLEAEPIRDLALAVSGLFVRKIGGASVRPPQPPGISELTYAGSARWTESGGEDRYRRGLYIWFQRTSPYPTLMTFDTPDSNICAIKREKSNTPLQALTLMNDVAFMECARALGKRIAETAGDTPSRLKSGWKVCFGRDPAEPELRRASALIQELKSLYAANQPAECAKLLGKENWAGDPVEAAVWVVLARAMMNLDEFVTRE